MKTLDALRKNRKVQYIDDERDIGNGVIVTLMPWYQWDADPGCGVRGFDSVTEALREVRSGTSEKEE